MAVQLTLSATMLLGNSSTTSFKGTNDKIKEKKLQRDPNFFRSLYPGESHKVSSLKQVTPVSLSGLFDPLRSGINVEHLFHSGGFGDVESLKPLLVEQTC